MYRVLTIFLLIFFSTSTFAQKKSAPRISTQRIRSSLLSQSATSLPRTSLRILGIMVQFQEDNDDLTTGNGKFKLQNVAAPMIDPPQHDSVYFWNKLHFEVGISHSPL